MFTAADVKKLRDVTGVGMMDCKKALTEAGGDFEKAVAWLREKGLATAQKKAGRIAAEGVVAVVTAPDAAGIVEVNIETDFAAKNETFKKFAVDVAAVVAEKAPADLDALTALEYPGEGKSVKEVQIDRVQVIGENIQIRRFERYGAGFNVSYIHMGGKIGVLVQLEVSDDISGKSEVSELGKDIAMQIAAMRPLYLDSSSISPDAIKAEEEIQYNKSIEENREKNMPEDKAKQVAEKMLKGRMNKFFEDVCLLNQAFVKESKINVDTHVKNVAKALGGDIKIAKFTRYEAGEGLEKKEDNFAEEVAKMAGQ
ncbi:MAG: translation elongation factor Ts [Oscillospiraceae bacterium]|jgi:elongation factor Ts|nr:translation elongation factor Ts [Oscillospiraceae bacterium]